jgi:hypothetical protein
MAEIAQCALFISGCVFLYGLTVFLFRDQIKSGCLGLDLRSEVLLDLHPMP